MKYVLKNLNTNNRSVNDLRQFSVFTVYSVSSTSNINSHTKTATYNV